MQSKVKANWEPPSEVSAGTFYHSKNVQIQLTLTVYGTIINPEIIKSSGSEAIDSSVMKAIVTLRKKIMAPKEPLEFILDFNLY